jgi:hypothetical protein
MAFVDICVCPEELGDAWMLTVLESCGLADESIRLARDSGKLQRERGVVVDREVGAFESALAE